MTTGCACGSCGMRLAPAGQRCGTCELEATTDPLVAVWLRLALLVDPDIQLVPYGQLVDQEAGS
jgi:hypothetical protein